MGARALERRSSGRGRSPGGDIPAQSDSTGPPGASALLQRRGPRLYLAGLLALSIAACFLPLADHLGYELSELVALYAGMFGAAAGVAAARSGSSRPRAVLRALWFAVWSLAVPVLIILANGLRRPACDPLAGLVLYAAVAVPSALLSAALGLACAFRAPRWPGAAAAGVFV